MNRHQPLRSLAILALLPIFGMMFWLTAVLTSDIPGPLVVGVNVHGLTLATYAGGSDQRLGPLSLRVLDDGSRVLNSWEIPDAGIAGCRTNSANLRPFATAYCFGEPEQCPR